MVNPAIVEIRQACRIDFHKKIGLFSGTRR